ncbi:hypothetical protein Lalb_Chr10g0094161 [Lupinus albus]|uniref:Uncharacterized protein n=1 Tax=Lupinus albus TaxID=3870 RepID=A0A6A4PTZ7_LUPAL|nr:hypothetical protein Lalb_Chr10g0094161 [Lupinus albus]
MASEDSTTSKMNENSMSSSIRVDFNSARRRRLPNNFCNIWSFLVINIHLLET